MIISGYTHLGTHDLPEYDGEGRWYRHDASGAEVYHVFTDDPENLFAFAFKTIPADSTGVAHILEHTVLCGSQKYRVKDPFIQLVKGSLNTFLNAMTYPDKTVYPASSTVKKDLFNILEVYGDAVFAPLLKREFFRQEGHHLEYNDDGDLSVSGIVYNEMKGVYSSHDSIAASIMHRALLPDTPYGFDYGGDPASIPDLTYEAFADFHRTYYHPSNARIFLYGDTPSEEYLEFLDQRFLSGFSVQEIDERIPSQTRWESPREMTISSPADAEDGTTSITVGWLLDPITDPEFLLAHELLAYILLGSNAGPLRKALIESGLGEDLSAPSGIETDVREMLFAVGLRGTSEERRDEVERLILDAVQTIAKDGIPDDIVEAALRKVEFRNREIKGGGPNGLRLMGKSLRGWLHGEAPDATLRFAEPFVRIRKRAVPGSRFFESLIETSLIANQHRITVVVKPDPAHHEREEAALADRLAAVKSSLTTEGEQQIRDEQTELDALQSAPDTPDDLASIPFLSVADLPVELPSIPSEQSQTASGVPVYLHDVYANGIVYIDLAFDISGLDPELLSYVPLYADAIGELSLPGRRYDEVATEISLKTGGFSSGTEAGIPLHEDQQADRRMLFRVRSLETTLEDAVDLLRELLLETQFTDADRLTDLVKEIRSGMSGSIIPSGHQYALLRAGRAFSSASRYEELWRGATQLAFVDELPNADVAAVGKTLARIGREIMRSGNLVVNLTGADGAIRAAMPAVDRLVSSLPDGGFAPRAAEPASVDLPRAESLVVPANVGFVAAAVRGSRFGNPAYVHEQVLAHLLRTGYLWEAIRMKGGAYGAGAVARGMDSTFSFYSYRDPNIVETLEAYRASLDRAATGSIDQDELDLAIIGVTGNFIRPLSPAEKGSIALRRSLYGISDELRMRNHETLLGTRKRDIAAAAARLRQEMDNAYVAVVAGTEAIDKASATVPELGANRIVLPV